MEESLSNDKKNKHEKKLMGDSLFSLVTHALIYLKALIIFPLVIKAVGTETYGGYSLFLLVLGFFVGISSFGISFSARRHLPSTDSLDERAELFFPQFYFQLAIVILFSVLWVLARGFFDQVCGRKIRPGQLSPVRYSHPTRRPR